MKFEIIDFHTHPFIKGENNICCFESVHERMDLDYTREQFRHFEISTICGSVLSLSPKCTLEGFEKCKADNRTALEIRDNHYGDFYIPGIHIHPDFIDESIEELRLMKTKGVKLIGELLPGCYGWKHYDEAGFDPILDEAAKLGYICNFHCYNDDAMDTMVSKHPDMIFVGAHPGFYDPDILRQIERAQKYENYYLDISGYGTPHFGSLRTLIDKMGIDRLLFGSDYPTCTLSAYVGAVEYDPLLSDKEKEQIFSLNAKRILGL